MARTYNTRKWRWYADPRPYYLRPCHYGEKKSFNRLYWKSIRSRTKTILASGGEPDPTRPRQSVKWALS